MGIVLGLISVAFFIFDYVMFSRFRPVMVAFGNISSSEEGLLNWVAVGLLVLLAFYSLSLFRLAAYLRKAKKVTFPSLLLLAGGVLSLLFVFSDVALLSDIGKQYKHGLSQPEWSLLYPIMGFQFITTAVFTYLHLFGFKKKNQVERVVRDSNIFSVVQYVGIICGLMGLTLSSLGFLFPSAWNLDMHVTISSIVLLTPYLLAVGYWFVTKLQEEQRQWYDEKQLQDVGKSAFLTLVLSVVFMVGLFVANYSNLGGVVSVAWLPLYLFFVLLLFSAGNLYFSGKD